MSWRFARRPIGWGRSSVHRSETGASVTVFAAGWRSAGLRGLLFGGGFHGGAVGHDRAWVRVTAHAFGLAAGGSVWWAPKVKGRASGGLYSEGVSSRRGWRAAARDGSALLVALGVARRCWAAVAACGCAVFWVPRHVSALRKQTGPVASSRIAVAGHRFRSAGHHRPGQLGYARRRGEEPRTQHPYGEKDPPNEMVGSCRNGTGNPLLTSRQRLRRAQLRC